MGKPGALKRGDSGSGLIDAVVEMFVADRTTDKIAEKVERTERADRAREKIAQAKKLGRSVVSLFRGEILALAVSDCEDEIGEHPDADPYRVAAKVLTCPTGATGINMHGVEVKIAEVSQPKK